MWNNTKFQTMVATKMDIRKQQALKYIKHINQSLFHKIITNVLTSQNKMIAMELMITVEN